MNHSFSFIAPRLFIFLGIICLSLYGQSAHAQIGVDTNTPDASAVLDLTSDEQGILIPRMTATERAAIDSPATSLLVFDTTEDKFYFYNGSAWIVLNPFEQTSGSTTATYDGDVVVDGTITATTYGNLEVDGVVPTGGIIMWSGSSSDIPDGWALCNGANGTPNLTDRFILGAGSSYAAGASGGSTSVTLTSDNMPSHTHTISSGGGHTHSVEFNDAYYLDGNTSSSQAIGGVETLSSGVRGSTSSGNSKTDLSYRVLTVTTETAGAHTHTIGSSGSASPSAMSIIPPYYALAFIMKL